ncbi:MAPK/MAK/MRK overlapping kinase-like isoform X1 [Haliotis rufescens]|uniref:MAPK/MAK/MRK overlapping kinase-like isoform X1 n=1 Tax=Haliotis rufescens TaxID=6454 RepID=UPI00201F00AC|nr:MAPK/MAK/MRK overlapping kinase-like isoform X1 [Haliotis rufescens]
MNLLLSKYRILGKKGEGTFSDVLKCQNTKDGTYVACKKMKQTYESLDQVQHLREVQAMRRLNPHTNVLDLLEIIFDKKSGTLVLVVELMDMNMYELIKGKRHYLPERKVKHYMYQLIKSIEHMHRNGIFHRDVKPENILIKEDMLKLADFGSCRSMYSKQPYTEYISTRWYRAPECLLTDGYYTYKMDMWSVGCVFFEILSLHPLFPGSNEVDQIAKIHDIMGTPENAVLKKMKNRSRGARSRGISFNFPQKQGTGVERLLPHVSQEAVALINMMCTYDPEERVTAHRAIKHGYFKELREADRRAAALAQPRRRDEGKKSELHERPVRDRDRDRDRERDRDRDRERNHEPVETIGDKKKEPVVQDERPSEVVMYPIRATKAQSNPAKGRRQRHHNLRRYAESQQYPNHTGLLPRVTMHHPTYNPTYHSTSMPAYHPKHFEGPSGGLPAINNVNTFKPHKAQSKPIKNLFTYTLPSVDRQ